MPPPSRRATTSSSSTTRSTRTTRSTAVLCSVGFVVVVLLGRVPHAHAFSPVVPSAIAAVGGASGSSCAVLSAAAKKRRRRKDDAVPPGGPSGDLPDFELSEDSDGRKEDATPAKKNNKPKSSSSSQPPPPAVVVRAEGPMTSAKSVRELIADRSLEQKMEFDAASSASSSDNDPLPDLVELIRGKTSATTATATTNDDDDSVSPSSSSSSLGKKKARQEARRMAALAREQELEEEENNFFSRIPFLVDESTGEVTAVKVLEAGTWLGIALLLFWEVYINSPFFDRSGPMAPIVY